MMRDAVLKAHVFSDVFARADYPAFGERQGRILRQTPPEEHDRLRTALPVPILSRNGLEVACEAEGAECRHHVTRVAGRFA
ncbi:hypothetical protein ROA7023_02763 [Roseisalinus antarcticus]|uniref:Uncharacterized protein n=2 Tax=Roseisalinus antarcticus TaxID=254357 RepID=A0A1Y5TB45_9RHOB|nr:hypothetical protein ROA7023_02763 [Roseisalinus antarcticus]